MPYIYWRKKVSIINREIGNSKNCSNSKNRLRLRRAGNGNGRSTWENVGRHNGINKPRTHSLTRILGVVATDSRRRCARCPNWFPSIRCPKTAKARVPSPSNWRRCPSHRRRRRSRCSRCFASSSWSPLSSCRLHCSRSSRCCCCTPRNYWRCPSSVLGTYRLLKRGRANKKKRMQKRFKKVGEKNKISQNSLRFPKRSDFRFVFYHTRAYLL